MSFDRTDKGELLVQPELLQRVLVDNPQALYRFEALDHDGT